MLPAKTRRNIESPRRVSLEAYFKAEEKALHKHEYHNGIVKPMAGATFNHNVLVSKAITFINIFIEENNFGGIDLSSMLSSAKMAFSKRNWSSLSKIVKLEVSPNFSA
mgnify:CR=1 FL=1